MLSDLWLGITASDCTWQSCPQTLRTATLQMSCTGKSAYKHSSCCLQTQLMLLVVCCRFPPVCIDVDTLIKGVEEDSWQSDELLHRMPAQYHQQPYLTHLRVAAEPLSLSLLTCLSHLHLPSWRMSQDHLGMSLTKKQVRANQSCKSATSGCCNREQLCNSSYRNCKMEDKQSRRKQHEHNRFSAVCCLQMKHMR